MWLFNQWRDTQLLLAKNIDRSSDLLEQINLAKVTTDADALRKQDYLTLHIQEYNALRAEQRTRLDAANRLIHYNVLVIGFVIAGLLASYKHDNINEFMSAFQTALLMLPLLSMPFTFTQWNDEIIVDNIGQYLEKMTTKITSETEVNYWEWEREHNATKPWVLQVTAIIRSGFFTFFSIASLLAYQIYFRSGILGLPDGVLPVDRLRRILFLADLILLAIAFVTLLGMGWRKFQRGRLYG